MHYTMVNLSMNAKKIVTPEVGMCGTYFGLNDRYPVVCTEVKSPKHVVIIFLHEGDIEKMVTDENGIMRLPEEEMAKHEHATREAFSLRKTGAWVREGRNMYNGGSVLFGEADYYYCREI